MHKLLADYDNLETALHAFAMANQRYGWLRERGFADDKEKEEIEQAKQQLVESTNRLYFLAFGRESTSDDLRLFID